MRSRRRSTGRWKRGQSALPIVALQLSFGDISARVRFADFPRADLAGLRALPRVTALPLRAAARFFRRAMSVAFSAEFTQFGAPFYIPLRPGRLVLTELTADSPYARHGDTSVRTPCPRQM
jgi:hypothetical protein